MRDVVLMEPQDLKKKFPWMSTDGLALGSLGLKGEGTQGADPSLSLIIRIYYLLLRLR